VFISIAVALISKRTYDKFSHSFKPKHLKMWRQPSGKFVDFDIERGDGEKAKVGSRECRF
jgi:hypothetical protein